MAYMPSRKGLGLRAWGSEFASFGASKVGPPTRLSYKNVTVFSGYLGRARVCDFE